jgi:hypothetical protein
MADSPACRPGNGRPCDECRERLRRLIDGWIREAEDLEAKRRAADAKAMAGYWGELAKFLKGKRREVI